jgi:hypothetical protein
MHAGAVEGQPAFATEGVVDGPEGSEFRVLAFLGGDEVGIISSYLTSS